MKKVSLLLIICILLLVGCSNGNNVKTTSNNQVSQGKGYVFEDKGITIAMHDKVESIKGLTEAKEYFEADSCAFQGKEKVYTYSGYELHTYEKDGVDHVATVVFLDDSVATKKGIYLNSSLEDVLAAYGDKYTENLGVYTYELDKTQLSFMIENDVVTSIEYIAMNN